MERELGCGEAYLALTEKREALSEYCLGFVVKIVGVEVHVDALEDDLVEHAPDVRRRCLVTYGNVLAQIERQRDKVVCVIARLALCAQAAIDRAQFALEPLLFLAQQFSRNEIIVVRLEQLLLFAFDSVAVAFESFAFRFIVDVHGFEGFTNHGFESLAAL